MTLRRLLIVCAITLAQLLAVGPANARRCSADAVTTGNALAALGQCASGPQPSGESSSSTSGSDDYSEYRWKLDCIVSAGAAFTCMLHCPVGQLPYQLMGLRNGSWHPLDVKCDAFTPADPNALVTPALVARAFQRVPLPALRAVTQPADKTLINFDTIFYVDAPPLNRVLTLLGQRVELAIKPSTFRWVHGDGTTAVTQTAGAAYPAEDVVYRYQQAHVTVLQHVEIVWTARWSLNGGPLQDVDGTVTTVGPDTPLRIAEATPALSGYGH
jgi:hypothetical protein